MAHVVAPNLRGKAVSATKVTKKGEPKRSGNWSYQTVHIQSIQHKDYQVRMTEGRLIVGDHTPLANVMGKLGAAIEDLAIQDQYLENIVRGGYASINGKQYESHKRLTRTHVQYSMDDIRYMYREEIYTDGDFDYTFPEY